MFPALRWVHGRGARDQGQMGEKEAYQLISCKFSSEMEPTGGGRTVLTESRAGVRKAEGMVSGDRPGALGKACVLRFFPLAPCDIALHWYRAGHLHVRVCRREGRDPPLCCVPGLGSMLQTRQTLSKCERPQAHATHSPLLCPSPSRVHFAYLLLCLGLASARTALLSIPPSPLGETGTRPCPPAWASPKSAHIPTPPVLPAWRPGGRAGRPCPSAPQPSTARLCLSLCLCCWPGLCGRFLLHSQTWRKGHSGL